MQANRSSPFLSPCVYIVIQCYTSHLLAGCLIDSCIRGLEWQVALSLLFETMPAIALAKTAVTVGTAISACGNSFEWDRALKVLNWARDDRVKLDAVVLLASGSHVGCRHALCHYFLWQASLSAGQCDTVRYNASIAACEKGYAWEIALNLLGRRQKCITADDVALCVDSCDSSLIVDPSERMLVSQVEPSYVTYNSLISCSE